MTSPFRLLRSSVHLEPNDVLGRVAFVDDFMSRDDCRRILALADARPAQAGLTGPSGKQDSGRESLVRFVWPDADSEWLFQRLEQGLLRLNAAYGFDLAGFYEGAQVATYEPGGHYGWHVDLGAGPRSNRKLSLSVQLSDASDYQGGEFEFLCATDETAPKTMGSLIAFPSFVAHRVKPVTAGVRRSLVSWISGPVFS